jgi:hypothetical protein
MRLRAAKAASKSHHGLTKWASRRDSRTIEPARTRMKASVFMGEKMRVDLYEHIRI